MFRALSCTLLSSALVYSQDKPNSFIYQNLRDSVFTISFSDLDTNELKATCSGFFITDDGLGITSGPFARTFKGSSVSIRFNDGRVVPCKVNFYPNVPGVAFIEIEKENDKRPTRKIPFSSKDCVEGQDLFILANRNSHFYFDKVFVTDTQHKWIEYKDGELFSTPVMRTTGVVPKASFGSPLIDLDGKVVAVVANVENGLAIGYSVKYLKEIYKEENKSYKIWEQFRDNIVDKVRNIL